MNAEIKHRIAKINNGQLPEGYEKTSFGIFPCDWEKDKSLGDICEINPKTEALPNEFIYIDLESVVDGKLIQENVIIEKAKAPSRAQRVLQKNDIIYQMVRPYQKNNFIFIQDDGNYKYVASTGYAQLRSDNYGFLYQMVNSEYFCTQVLKKCTGTNYPAINSQDLAEVNCAYPKTEQEQSSIAEILMQWDKTIELQGKLVEAYQKVKKYCLNKMFPKKGCNVPEIRFPGFTAPWEQRKLSDEVQITMGQSPDGTTYRETPSKYILVQGNADLKDGWVYPRIWTTQKTKTADAGALIMSVRAPAGSMGKTAYNVVLGRGVAAIKGNEFIFQTLVKMDSDGYWKKLAAGSTFESINSDTISNAVISLPRQDDEQSKIGEWFNLLDNLITLHQKKREKLVIQRKILQQYLLTGIVRV